MAPTIDATLPEHAFWQKTSSISSPLHETAELADCLKLWDAGTHMSKADWARTCRRVQGRLDNIKSEAGKSAARSGQLKPQ